MKYLRRLVWFIASRLAIVTLVVALMAAVFYEAMNLCNVQVVLKDGMAMRAKVVMGISESGELTKYFNSGFLERDEVLNAASPYSDYRIVGIDHRLEMGFFWTWPWDTTVRVDITERIPNIDGRAKGSTADAVLASTGTVYPPSWQSARYRATVVKENGSWKIKDLRLIEYLDETDE